MNIAALIYIERDQLFLLSRSQNKIVLTMHVKD